MKTAILALTLLAVFGSGDPVTLVLKGGDHLRAEVLEQKENRVHLRVPTQWGHYSVWRDLDDFQPHSAYRALAELAAQDNADDRLRLARFAASHDLVYVAQRELRLARQLAGDESLHQDLERDIAARGARALEKLFRSALKRGDLRKAKRLLNELIIRYPDSNQAAHKEGLRVEYEQAEKAAADERRRASLARKQAQLERHREAKLRPIRGRLERAVRDNRQGLLSSKSFSKAHGLFQRAIHGFEAVTKDADKLLKNKTNDVAFVREVSELRQRAVAATQEALLNAASVCLVRGQFARALGHANRVLALDPENGNARAMRARIETAANESGWGW